MNIKNDYQKSRRQITSFSYRENYRTKKEIFRK